MRTPLSLIVLFATMVIVSATVISPNADRMRRGLPPLAPRQLYNPTVASGAKRQEPSGSASNAERMKRGLPPLPPRRPYAPTATYGAKRQEPSGSTTASQCPESGTNLLCCGSVTTPDNPEASGILVDLDIMLGDVTLVGLDCTVLDPADTCTTTPTCCTETLAGIISIGCVNVNV
ncbi:hypothetical protein PUNSTDRAFT_128538 [Punctularia strigosozonata HHB-11173 SS5]|uniref:Hydrophobin n=1 Tax=Punctularia strigosozonata (strain HHB-11173) TaxID=741275 RepID=R7S187_PUNST|nr:uncharacterized protein PUNSTDRAFT_128538 [Punctularia strigosozonata HHB-11173 SS5]EIN03988.1 hypothetical protein PUNSTDRAFT_128538 [Punctularia strigosozonata HHB-11173 SS5]